MTYEFFCDECGEVHEVERPMAEAGNPASCPRGHPMRRLYSSYFHCDELRSTRYFDPNARVERTDHGRKFDIGMGCWYRTKSERRKLMKERGLNEHGIREV